MPAAQNGTTQAVHFRDRRAPQLIQFQLERELMILTQPESTAPLVFAGSFHWGVIQFTFHLRFEAALAVSNAYSLTVDASWPPAPESENASRAKSAKSWFDLWTKEFQPADPVKPGDGSAARYRALAEEALHSEAHLTGVPEIQQAILTAMRNGATYSTAHKEGGTEIKFSRGQFVRSDYGDNPGMQTFGSDAEFLLFLRKFYDWETSRHVAPAKVSEYEAWKLILRLLRGSATAAPSSGGLFERFFGRK